MNALHVPLDYERLPEFRRLVLLLRSAARPNEMTRPDAPSLPEMAANHLWMRLWVELGLCAQSTNAPGYFTALDMEQFEALLADTFGDGATPEKLLTEARVLVKEEGRWFCPWFAKMNEHLAGDHHRSAEKGNRASAIARQQKRLSAEAVAQGTLLPPEIYRTRAGQAMSTAERNAALLLIRNLDNCLGVAQRRPGSFTEGLMADAHDAASAYSAAHLKAFYLWLSLNRAKPNVPRSTEHILRDFATYFGAAKVAEQWEGECG